MESTVMNKFHSDMKMEDIKKITPLKKEEISLPLEGMSEEEKRSMYYCDLADSQLNSIWY